MKAATTTPVIDVSDDDRTINYKGVLPDPSPLIN